MPAKAQARAGALPEVVEELLTLHYDPGYARSMERNYRGFAEARPLELPGWDAATLDRYLTNPEQALPHGKMLYDGLADAQQRRVGDHRFGQSGRRRG